MARLGHLGYLIADLRRPASAATPALHLHGGGATSARTWCLRRYQTVTTNISWPSFMRPPWMAVRKDPGGPPDKQRSLAASSPFLVPSCCNPSSPFLLSRNSIGRPFDAAFHPHSSAYRSWSLPDRSRTEVPLAPCREHSAAGRPFRLRSAWPAPAASAASVTSPDCMRNPSPT